jgi:hypothetical protein
MPNLKAEAVASQPTTHVEFEMTRADVQKFANDLLVYLQASKAATVHLQIQRRGVAPPTGGTAAISKGDPVTISIHDF